MSSIVKSARSAVAAVNRAAVIEFEIKVGEVTIRYDREIITSNGNRSIRSDISSTVEGADGAAAAINRVTAIEFEIIVGKVKI